jgi:hypothetical protein
MRHSQSRELAVSIRDDLAAIRANIGAQIYTLEERFVYSDDPLGALAEVVRCQVENAKLIVETLEQLRPPEPLAMEFDNLPNEQTPAASDDKSLEVTSGNLTLRIGGDDDLVQQIHDALNSRKLWLSWSVPAPTGAHN